MAVTQLCRSQSNLLIILFRQYIIRRLKLVECLFCYAFHILFGKACLPDDFRDTFYFSFFFSPELRVCKLGNSSYLYDLFVSNLLELFLFNAVQGAGRRKDKHVFIKRTKRNPNSAVMVGVCIFRCVSIVLKKIYTQSPFPFVFFSWHLSVLKILWSFSLNDPDFGPLWQNCHW